MSSRSRSYDQPDVLSTINPKRSSTTGGCVPAASSFQELAKRIRGSYYGELTSDYKRRVQAGELLPFTYYRRYDSVFTQSGYAKLVFKPAFCSAVGTNSSGILEYGNADIASTWGQVLLDELTLTKLFDKAGINPQIVVQKAASKAMDGFDGGTFLAELHKSLELVFSLRKKAVALLSARPPGLPPLPYIRLNWKRLIERALRNGTKDAANSWLEWYYGWRQLAKDANDINRVVNSIKPQGITTFHATEEWSESFQTILTTPTRLNGETFDLLLNTVNSVSVRGTFSNRSGYGHGAYLSPITLYEIIPYSFVFDWFINVSQAIQAMMSTLMSTQSEACYSVAISCTLQGNVTNARHNGTSLQTFEKSGTSLYNGNVKWRTPTKVSFAPMLAPSLNATRLLNLAALIAQRVI